MGCRQTAREPSHGPFRILPVCPMERSHKPHRYHPAHGESHHIHIISHYSSQHLFQRSSFCQLIHQLVQPANFLHHGIFDGFHLLSAYFSFDQSCSGFAGIVLFIFSSYSAAGIGVVLSFPFGFPTLLTIHPPKQFLSVLPLYHTVAPLYHKQIKRPPPLWR